MPPYSSGNASAKTSFSRRSSTASHGNSAVRSTSAALGAMRSRASVRTASTSSSRSSVTPRSAPPVRCVIVSNPSAVTAYMFSIPTAPRPGKTNLGSTAITFPSSSGSSKPGASTGSSSISMPTPWPRNRTRCWPAPMKCVVEAGVGGHALGEVVERARRRPGPELGLDSAQDGEGAVVGGKQVGIEPADGERARLVGQPAVVAADEVRDHRDRRSRAHARRGPCPAPGWGRGRTAASRCSRGRRRSGRPAPGRSASPG